MEKLITVEDVKNELGIDVVAELGKTPQYAERFLSGVATEVLNHIADYAFYHMAQVRRYLANPHKRAVIREAVLDQVVFLSANGWVNASDIADKNVANGTIGIATKAHERLLNEGLLSVARPYYETI